MNARVLVLARLFIRVTQQVLECEGYNLSEIEWKSVRDASYHSNQYSQDGEVFETHHKLACGYESMRRLLDDSVQCAGDMEYPWINDIPDEVGVDYSSARSKAKYIAIHEAAHVLEMDNGGTSPSRHDDLFESVLRTLLAKYWEVL